MDALLLHIPSSSSHFQLTPKLPLETHLPTAKCSPSFLPIRSVFFCAAIALCLFFSVSVHAENLTGDLIIFHAGSLAVPFKEVADAFMQENPNLRILREAAGSRESARKIADLGRSCDVMASADYVVIDTLLIPNHASWNIRFAGNEMIIAFNEHSRYAREIDDSNWPDILMRPEVALGRSDPNSDPCGYRTLLTVKLAEEHYNRPGFFSAFITKDVRYMRPKETDLLALLETHVIDYLFIYRSVAEQHHLNWLPLPDSVNLKSNAHADTYASVSVEINGAAPGTTLVQKGEPMVYGVTIPKNAPNPKAAEAFVSFLLNPEKGLAIMAKNGQPGLVPALSATYDAIPESLKQFAKKP